VASLEIQSQRSLDVSGESLSTKYSEARPKAQMWRDNHLDSLEEARFRKDNSTPAKECKAHKHSKQQRKQARNVKCIQHKLGKGLVTKLYYTENNVRTMGLRRLAHHDRLHSYSTHTTPFPSSHTPLATMLTCFLTMMLCLSNL
jgi:hypothetical protein